MRASAISVLTFFTASQNALAIVAGSCRRHAVRRPRKCRWKRRRARRRGDGAILEDNFDFHGGISAAVEDLAADDIDDLKNLFHGYRSPFQCERNTSAWMGCAANLRPGTGERPFITIQNYKEVERLCQAHSGKQRAEMCLRAALFRKFYPGAGEKARPRRKTAGTRRTNAALRRARQALRERQIQAQGRDLAAEVFLSRPVAAGAQNWK